MNTRSQTRQYGLIYHSSFIGRAGPKHKGRISRFLANKCSIASRIDCYSGTLSASILFVQNVLMNITEAPTSKFGEALRQQVEERLLFFEKGEPPSKNADAMRKVLESLAIDEDEADEPALPLIEAEPVKVKKDKKKRKRDDDDEGEDDGEAVKKVKLSKEEKKALKKAKKEAAAAAEVSFTLRSTLNVIDRVTGRNSV